MAEDIRKIRDSIRKKATKGILEHFLQVIESAIKQEDEKLSKEVILDLITELEDSIKAENPINTTTVNRIVNCLPKSGEIFAEDSRIRLSVISDAEKEHYINVSYECSVVKGAFENTDYVKYLWEEFLDKNAFVCSIYDRETDEYIGYCSVKDLRQKYMELAIEEKELYRNQGYGTRAIRLFTTKLTELLGERFYRVRIDMDNYASQKLFKKVGAYPNGISEFLLKGKELERFRKENIGLIDEKMRQVAEEFCMDAEDMLGYVLEYLIDMQNVINEIIPAGRNNVGKYR